MSVCEVRVEKASDNLNATSTDGQDVHAHLIAAAELAQTDRKDMDWERALADTTHSHNAITDLEDEVASLEATILTRLRALPEGAEFADSVRYACPLVPIQISAGHQTLTRMQGQGSQARIL